MQVIDHCPSDILHCASDRHDQRQISTCHLYQFSKTDHKSCCRHNCNYRHQYFSKLLQKIKIKIKFLLFLFCFRFISSISAYFFLFCFPAFFCQDQHFGLTGFYISFYILKFFSLCVRADEYRCDRINLFFFQILKIYFCNQVSGFYFISGFPIDFKAFSV